MKNLLGKIKGIDFILGILSLISFIHSFTDDFQSVISWKNNAKIDTINTIIFFTYYSPLLNFILWMKQGKIPIGKTEIQKCIIMGIWLIVVFSSFYLLYYSIKNPLWSYHPYVGSAIIISILGIMNQYVALFRNEIYFD